MTHRILYKRLALAEVVTWTLLILGMIGKYGLGFDWATMVGGSVHGFVFLCYAVATVAVWTDKRWTAGTGVLGLASAVIPYATVPFERSVERRGLLDARGGSARRATPRVRSRSAFWPSRCGRPPSRWWRRSSWWRSCSRCC